MRGRTLVFAGPTLPRGVILEILPTCELHPPVAAGDLLRLGLGSQDRVVIIDGFFFHCRAVRHKEILWLLHSGIEVFGAASMGALRAAELHTFGMRGHGCVFDQFLMGTLDGDDEVAILHTADEPYRPVTEALVNIRFACKLAVEQAVIDERTSQQLVVAAKALSFQYRTYNHILDVLNDSIPSETVMGFKDFVRTMRPDIKKADACSLLRFLTGLPRANPPPHCKQLADTIYLRSMRESQTGQSLEGVGFISDTDVLDFCQLMLTDWVGYRRKIATNVLATLALGTDTDERIPIEEIEHRIDCARRARSEFSGLNCNQVARSLAVEYIRSTGLLGRSSLISEEARRWLSAAEQVLPLDEQVLLVGLRTFRLRLDYPWRDPFIGQLKAEGKFSAALRRVEEVWRYNKWLRDSVPAYNERPLKQSRMLSWFFSRLGAHDDESRVLADRGYSSVAEFSSAATKFYLFDKFARPPSREVKLADLVEIAESS